MVSVFKVILFRNKSAKRNHEIVAFITKNISIVNKVVYIELQPCDCSGSRSVVDQ